MSRQRSLTKVLLALVAALSMVLAAPGSAFASDYFSDVDDGDPFHDEISRLFELDITTGFQVEGDDPEFRPNLAITRQAVIAFAFRAAGAPEGEYTEDFSDVDPGDPFYEEISWAATTGVSDGFSDGTFRPTDNVTRQAFTAFVYRLAGEPTGDFSEDFSDVDEDHPFFTAIAWAATNNIVNGYEDGTFRSTRNITRQAVAAILVRAIEDGFFGPNTSFEVTPEDEVTLSISDPEDSQDDRTFAVSGLDDSETYNIRLFPAENVTTDMGTVSFADGDLTADQADPGDPAPYLRSVNNSDTGTMSPAAEATPVNGTILFTTDADSADEIIPVVWLDSTDNDALDLDADDEPTEPFGIGGQTNWIPPEAAQGANETNATVASVDKSDDFFTTDTALYEYDSNDSFTVDGQQATFEQFEAALSSSDTITITDYQPDDSLESTFDLVDSNPTAPGNIDATQDGTAVDVTWTAADDVDSYNVYRALDDGSTCGDLTDDDYSLLGSTSDTEFVDGSVELPEEYCYTVSSVNDGQESDFGTADFVATTEPDTTAPTSVDAEVTTNILVADSVSNGDEWRVIFSEPMAAVEATDRVRVEDGDGTISDVTCDDSVASCSFNGSETTIDGTTYEPGEVLTVTIIAPADPVSAGSTEGLQYPLTIIDQAGFSDGTNAWDIAASADVVIDEESDGS